MSPEGSKPGFQVDQRVQSVKAEKTSSKQLGTVKYVGPVEGYDGLWVGVDWDTGLGRHNGTVNGKHYFETTTKESGSLVRPNSLSTGITLAEALIERYNASATTTSSGEDGMYVMSVRQRRMTVELVGKDQIEEKQKHLEDLKVVILAYAGVCSAGPRGQVGGLAPCIKELDLTGNLLPDWNAVGQICDELPLLRVLNLSCSRISMDAESINPALSNIQTLVLNNCHITWQQVDQLKLSLKSLEELHLCGNNIRTIEASEHGAPGVFVDGFELLRLLNLEDNNIVDWAEILKLSKLKSLEHLNLNSNGLEEVLYPVLDPSFEEDKEAKKSIPFQNLRCLLLGKNKIARLDSVDALNHFPSLKDVRLSENPLVDGAGVNASRFLLVARIGNITSLNGSEVKARERKDAEIRYVRYVLNSVLGQIDDSVLKKHPRFLELKAKHDIPMESAQSGAALASHKMSASFLSVTIMCVSLSVGEKAPVTRKLPSSTTVGKLKQICEGLFKVKAANQCLYVKDEDTPLPVALDNDLESIHDLGLGQDSVILVDEAKGH
ncbi:tubulin-specific chaperone E [Marchantia polymorpha subsp. ruderalis]|uniref:CAP-Gly domain-containing protein n=2 Tax=Marchantia polymorpha TaxID=3197 RepID=A0AAF6BWL3_MARPO|nr:hypothetical protein MARPO_0057s0080 [Marchantia polymorpha]PTQ37462.1 hypothetical protein MARPO_0057s0080 [Marchantia polymorpha]BBN16397.1 hypothetical protein Mp_7g05910 [Marchantia polymorpha subsp. ruderalis]BBN16398.1 hypothetical protein Mp_7g05910 [Marchantia polymorpha subsp. ruderalis]|eukprot:PTQ37460.1 hypothetical protein MARPO_0057s0080 [Marchantia polymorpha]